jgi:hypothetical protein
MTTRVTLWIEQDDMVVSLTWPWDNDFEEYDGDPDGAIGVMESMGQMDRFSGIFYEHDNVTRVKIEKKP